MTPSRYLIYIPCILILFIVTGYVSIIHLFKSSALSLWNSHSAETNTIYLDTNQKHDSETDANELMNSNSNANTGSYSDLFYLSKAINHQRYEISDFSFFWDQSDGSPLFINASKYDSNHNIGYQSFVFCPMPKNGCSAWKQVLRRIKGEKYYLADDYWSLHSEHNHLEEDRIHQFGVDGANDILYSPNIIHAVFIRDCIERALSAFLDKCIGSHWSKKYWCVPRSEDNDQITHKIYSQFDLYIDAIVDRPGRYQLDYHWLPQNFVCDLYKFAGRYHIYYSSDIRSRYDFLMDIGGERTWNMIGADGWVKSQNMRANRRRRRRRGRNRRRLSEGLAVSDDDHHRNYNELSTHHRKLKSDGVYIYQNISDQSNDESDSNESISSTERRVDSNGNVLQHKVKIMGKDAKLQMKALDLRGSFLDKQSYHSINASQRLYQFYRADLLAKVVAFYESDYVLFNMTLPSWICKYLCSAEITKWLRTVGQRDIDNDDGGDRTYMEIEGLSFGGYSTYFKDYDHDAVVVDKDNETWTRESEMERRKKEYTTLIPMMEEMRNFDTVHGTVIHRIRGIVVLSNMLYFVDQKILPQCLKDRWERDIRQKIDFWKRREKEEAAMVQLIDLYFNGYLKTKGVLLMERILEVNDGTVDAGGTFKRWENEDKILYHNIGENVLWMREAPRRFWTHELGKE